MDTFGKLSKSADDVTAALREGLEKMDGQPRMIYCDADNGIVANEARALRRSEGGHACPRWWSG